MNRNSLNCKHKILMLSKATTPVLYYIVGKIHCALDCAMRHHMAHLREILKYWHKRNR